MRISDWSSDVCSSDLADVRIAPQVAEAKAHQRALLGIVNADVALDQFLGLGTRDLDVEVAVTGVLGGTDQCGDGACQERSEERRVGKEGVSTWRARGWL